MKLFNLPDLGEGLPDAEIHEWFVKEGDSVVVDQPLVSMETAKAVVDVPCPYDGVISKLFGKVGDVIKTGDALVGFESQAEAPIDKGTVVGHLEQSTEVFEDNFTIGSTQTRARIRTTPAVKLLAKKLGVDINSIEGTGDHACITKADVERAARASTQIPDGYEPLRGAKRSMLASMVQSQQEVVATSIFDDANLSQWPEDSDITIRLIQAICAACLEEPALNAWFSTAHSALKLIKGVHLGLALDSSEGLFVPVIHDAQNKSGFELRNMINNFKTAVNTRTIPAEQLKGASITLSNFGKFAGRYATPIVVPPQVAIIAVGRVYESAVSQEGTIVMGRLLPLSLTFDHRAVTGGEATRFLATIIKHLERPDTK